MFNCYIGEGTPQLRIILSSLQIAAIIIKIKAETTTETTQIATETTETLATIKYTNNPIVTADPRDAIIKGWVKWMNSDLAYN